MNTVLVVDDKDMLRDSVSQTLQRSGFAVVTAADARSALEIIAKRRPEAVVTDLKMPGMTGLELLEEARKIDDTLPVVLMTAYGAVDTAVQALKLGAFDYITKPFEGDELIVAVKRAIDHAKLQKENAILRSGIEHDRRSPVAAVGIGHKRGLDRIVGDSPVMRRVKQQVLAVAESHGTVLICGESGTGKEVIARAIHELSARDSEPFLGVNCAALTEALLESELFGHERGAFTGAERLRKGRFELADRGTLLLDEISEITPSVQAKLLRVLQERAFERVGSSITIGIDVRVIATSNRDLPRQAARGEFRQDLFFRLNVLPIHLPPLRDRLDDVPALVAHFLEETALREGRPVKRISDDALAVLCAYGWPGNVREVHNICERAAVLCKSDTIERNLIEPWLMNAEQAAGFYTPGHAMNNGSHAPSHTSTNGSASFSGSSSAAPSGSAGTIVTLPGGGVLRQGSALAAPLGFGGTAGSGGGEGNLIPVDGKLLEDIEREAIVRTLHKFNGHRQRTAQALGIGVRTLGLKLKKWKQLQLVDAGL